jgi:predicted Zn-dependent protease
VSLQRSRDEMLALAARVLEAVPHGDAEVTVTEVDSSLTRFAHNAIHQNVAESSLTVRLRLQHEGRVGVSGRRGGAVDAAASVARLVADADDARRLAPPSDDLAPLPTPQAGADAAVEDAGAAYSQRTAAHSPEGRANSVAIVARVAAAAGVEAYGALSIDASQVAIANTRGIGRCARRSGAVLRATVRGDAGAGFADRTAVDVADLDADALAAEVVDTTLRNQQAQTLDPGTYEVVLSPYAVADLLAYFSGMVFNALAVQERRSCFVAGNRLASELLSLVDDPTDANVAGFPFDGEGVRSRRVVLLDRGIATELLYDSPTALTDGVASTGHSLPQPNTHGPFASHLAVAPGDASREALIGQVRRGLYITRLWYVRVVHELRTVITGMTREGTFLIEDGAVVRPVRDLRFTQSIVEALQGVRGVGAERRLEIDEYGGAVLAPHLHLGAFTFTS